MADGGSRNALRGRDLIGLGGLIVGAVVGGMVIGYLLDEALDSSPVCTLVGLAVGMVAGAAGFWVRVRSALRDSDSP